MLTSPSSSLAMRVSSKTEYCLFSIRLIILIRNGKKAIHRHIHMKICNDILRRKLDPKVCIFCPSSQLASHVVISKKYD